VLSGGDYVGCVGGILSDDENDIQLLVALGLSYVQAKVYLALANTGRLTISGIAKV
jgi:sugar-specific transcriptional regulator TrmB